MVCVDLTAVSIHEGVVVSNHRGAVGLEVEDKGAGLGAVEADLEGEGVEIGAGVSETETTLIEKDLLPQSLSRRAKSKKR